MSGYRHSGMTEQAYRDREALREAVEILNRYECEDDTAHVSGTLSDWINRVDWDRVSE
jgi:hypothetical protein